jgi:hypothetical protein
VEGPRLPQASREEKGVKRGQLRDPHKNGRNTRPLWLAEEEPQTHRHLESSVLHRAVGNHMVRDKGSPVKGRVRPCTTPVSGVPLKHPYLNLVMGESVGSSHSEGLFYTC